MNDNVLAFGITPSNRRYQLRYARYKALADTIANHIKNHGNTDKKFELLDVGPGFGRSMQYLEAEGAASKINFYGVDISERRLKNVYCKEKWNLIQADIEKSIPFSGEKFDIVICEQVLEHLHNPQFVISEISRILRPGGLLVLGVPIFLPFFASIRKHLVPLLLKLFRIPEGDHIQAFTMNSIKKSIKSIKVFKISEIRGFRIISGGIISFLENYRLWWKLNVFIGRIVPFLCTEVQLLAKKTTSC